MPAGCLHLLKTNETARTNVIHKVGFGIYLQWIQKFNETHTCIYMEK